MHPSRVWYKMASTNGGMRRILKKGLRTDHFIQKAVASGVYRERTEEGQQQQQTNQRQRRPPRKDPSDIQSYPIEYQILSLNPPLPDPPKIPTKLLREQGRQNRHPTEALLENYLKRHDAAMMQTNQHSEAATSDKDDEYYRRLLGVSSSGNSNKKTKPIMGQKNALLQKAYAFAIKQYEVMRLENMSEEESLDMVEQLLRQDDENERRRSRDLKNHIQEWDQQQKQEKKQKAKATPTGAANDDDEDEAANKEEEEEQDDTTTTTTTSVPSVLFGRPRVVQAISIWSGRLASVPYREWTIGARVALDHWVARSVLGLSEATWQDILEGETPSLRARALDVLETRQALFPETIQSLDNDNNDNNDDYEDHPTSLEDEATATRNDVASTEKSIEELLATLGAFDDEDEDHKEEKDHGAFSWRSKREIPENLDDQIMALVEQLQEWRTKHHEEQPYEQWDLEERQEFDEWLKDYVDTLKDELDSDDDDDDIDWVATRKSLLADPPQTKESSDAFWDSIRDESEAERFLDSWQDQQQEQNDTEEWQEFWKLDREVQIEKLVRLSALRPVLDEYYVPESQRVGWLIRNSMSFLEGLTLQHFVKDPEGPLTAARVKRFFGLAALTTKAERNKLSAETVVRVDPKSRYRLEAHPVQDGGSDVVLEAWKTQKAGRSRYEEHLFKSGKLGLRYNDNNDAPNETEATDSTK